MPSQTTRCRSSGNSWTTGLAWERLLVRHEALYPLIDKVRRFRNSVEHHEGTFTRSKKVHAQVMRSIGMLEMSIRSAGAEEGRRKKREAESGSGRGECRNAAATSGPHHPDAAWPSQPGGEFPR